MSVVESDKISQMLDRFVAVEAEMAAGPDGDTYVRLSMEYAELEPVVKIVRELKEALAEQESLAEMVASGEDDECAPEPAATRQRCSRVICSACISALRR